MAVWLEGIEVSEQAVLMGGARAYRYREVSYPAHAGYPVRRGLSIQSLTPLEYWIVRPSAQLRTRRTMTPNVRPHSRGAVRPRFASTMGPPKYRGRREDRVHAAPAVSRANAHGKSAHEHTGSAETLQPSLRNGFTAYSALSPVNGFLATVALEKLRFSGLNASTAASEPHDFTVRKSHTRQSQLSRPSHLTARS